MFKIFKKFLSHSEVYEGDWAAVFLNTVGGILIGLTFLIIGGMYLTLSHKAETSRRRRLCMLFGLFLISCSFSRLFSVICIHNNYAIADGWLKVLTGMLALLAIVYIPKTIKEVLHTSKLEETNRLLEKTSQDLNEVKRLSENITNQ